MFNDVTDRFGPDFSLRSGVRAFIVFLWKGGVIVEPLRERALVVGRSSACDLTIEASDLSREHARVTLAGDEVWVENMSATHETRLNGVAITRAQLMPGDELALGSVSCFASLRSAPAGELVARSEQMQRILQTVDRLASSTIPVLVTGETGTGKELIASRLHGGGVRRMRPLETVNCAAIPASLVESLLFGHERGAFSGAERRQPGIFERANGGTVFLDEIGELSLAAQASLLRVLETKRVRRIGGLDDLVVDVRIVAATHRDLHEMSIARTFREDLLYRINAITIEIPPLRRRVVDIAPLANLFLERANRTNGTNGIQISGIDPRALALLESHPWPGNVRELRNVIDRAALLAKTTVVLPEDIAGEG